MVCKRWYPLAEELLYSRIYIKDFRSLYGLAQQIGKRRCINVTDRPDGVGLGWWTRAIHLKITDVSYFHSIDVETDGNGDKRVQSADNLDSSASFDRIMNAFESSMTSNYQLLMEIAEACPRVHTLHIYQDDSAEIARSDSMRSWLTSLSKPNGIAKCTWYRFPSGLMYPRKSPFDIIQPLSSTITNLVIECDGIHVMRRGVLFPHVHHLRLEGPNLKVGTSLVSFLIYSDGRSNAND